jgi:glycosyltransferase involved in cell wall biosynthesis
VAAASQRHIRKGRQLTGIGTDQERGIMMMGVDTLVSERERQANPARVGVAGCRFMGRGPTAASGRRNRLPAIVITTNRPVYCGDERQKALLAAELDRRGYPVTIVCMQWLGPLIKEIPHTVRVWRQPWWAPVIDIPEGPTVLISGDTNTETGFATLWRAAGSSRRWLVAPHVPPEEDRPIYSRPLTVAMRRADGFIVLAHRHWDTLTVHHRLKGPRFIAPNGIAAPGGPIRWLRAAGKPPHLVMLSHIIERNNPHLLIEALNCLADMPWTLSIFGDGTDRERFQARIPTELRDRVHCAHGQPARVPPWPTPICCACRVARRRSPW